MKTIRFSFLFITLLIWATPAVTQQGVDDFPLKPSVEGKHPLRVQIVSTQPLASLCVDRADVDPPLELLCCVPGVDCVQDPNDGTIIELLVPLAVTLGEVVEIRARVVSEMGVPSAYSLNAAIADFTVPAAPILLVTE